MVVCTGCLTPTGNRCVYCDCEMVKTDMPLHAFRGRIFDHQTTDHVWPRKHRLHRKRKVLACYRCNHFKAERLPTVGQLKSLGLEQFIFPDTVRDFGLFEESK